MTRFIFMLAAVLLTACPIPGPAIPPDQQRCRNAAIFVPPGEPARCPHPGHTPPLYDGMVDGLERHLCYCEDVFAG